MPRLGAGAGAGDARSEEGKGEEGGGGALRPGNLTASVSGTAETRARQHRAATSGAAIIRLSQVMLSRVPLKLSQDTAGCC